MARTLQPDDRISHYRIVGPLGAGGMGEVYIAKDETLERSVALKILPPALVRNDERVRRFVTEAKSASSLNHPNIVTIYEIGRDIVNPARAGGDSGPAAGGPDATGSDPVHYISMELVTGETLDQKIHHEKVDLRTLLGWIAQAAEGIAKAHAAGIVHRDLKPGNIMVSKDGFAKVLDFGLAKLTERAGVTDAERTSAPTAVAATGEGVVMGTVGYMSPEQVQAKTVDHRSDIFSLGCILYEAATRRRPFVADSDIEVMHRIIKEKPQPVEELNPAVPGEVRRLVRRCLAKSPDQRFQSMKDLAIDLRELTEEWDTLSPSTPSGSTGASGGVRAVAGRGAGFWAIVGAAALIGIGGLGFGLYALLRREAPAAANVANTLQDLRMTVLISRDDLSETALSADGRYLAYVTTRDRTTSLKVRQVRTGSDVVIVPESEVPIRGVSFSPDGDYLYYLNRDPDSPNYSALFQVPSLGGAPRKMVFDVDSAATFSPDGKRACFRRGLLDQAADSLVVVDLGTGKERTLLRIANPEQFVAPPSWSPDGRMIVTGVQGTAGGVKTRLVAVDAESGKGTTIGSRTWLVVNSVHWMPDGGALLASALDVRAGLGHQVYRVAYPGGETVRLTNDLDGYTNLSMAADGSSVAAIRRATVDNLWVARPETKQEPQAITFASGSAGSIGQLEPLPGGAAAFTAPRENKTFLWRIAADGSDRRQLTSQGIFVINAEYADGAGLVFTQVDDEGTLAHIWRADLDGGGLRQLTDGNGEQLASLSPTGNALTFAKWDDPRSLWLLKLDGSAPRRIVEGRLAEDSALSPDGRRLLYGTLEEVKGRFFPRRHIMSVDGGAEEASFFLPPGATNVLWVPDGKALTYLDRGQNWNLMRKPLPDGEPVALTRFTDGQVVDHRWSRDGSRMVIHRRAGSHDSLWMLRTGETQPTLITEFKTGRLSRHFWAPDEPVLYFTYGNSTQDVVMISGVK